MSEKKETLWNLLGYLFKAHPWHGIPIGDEFPELVNAYIEVVPSDTIKYELDKSTGHLKVDRPQAYSNVCPTMYGFIPQTWCNEEIAQLCAERIGRKEIVADQDPLDICVISEKVVSHGDILMQARPIGGLRMIDRLRHYFLTYKQAPQSDAGTKTEITHVYGREEAYEVIRRAHNDYSKRFSRLESLLEDALAGE